MANNPTQSDNLFAPETKAGEDARLEGEKSGTLNFSGLNVTAESTHKNEQKKKDEDYRARAYANLLLNGLAEQLQRIEEEIERLESQQNSLEKKIIETESSILAAKEVHAALKGDLHETSADVKELAKKDTKIAETQKVTEQEFKQAQIELEEAEKKLAEIEKQPDTINPLTGQALVKQEDGTILTIDENGEKAEVDTVTQTLASAAAYLGLVEVKSDDAAIKKTLDQCGEDCQRLQTHIESLKEQRAANTDKIEKSNELIEQLTAKLEKEQQDIKAQTENLQEMHQENKELIDAIKTKKAEAEEIREQIKEKEEELGLLKEEDQTLTDKFNSLNNTLNLTHEQIAENQGWGTMTLERNEAFAALESKILDRIEGGSIPSSELKHLLSDSSEALRARVESMLDQRGIEVIENKWGIGNYQPIAETNPNTPRIEGHANELTSNDLTNTIHEEFKRAASEITKTLKPDEPKPVEPRHTQTMGLGA